MFLINIPLMIVVGVLSMRDTYKKEGYKPSFDYSMFVGLCIVSLVPVFNIIIFTCMITQLINLLFGNKIKSITDSIIYKGL